MDTRRCTKCGKDKELREFYRYETQTFTYCKACAIAQVKAYQERNLSAAADTVPFQVCARCHRELPASHYTKDARKRRGLIPYCKSCKRVINRYANYGMTEDEFQRLRDSQGNRCALCRQPETQVDRRNGKVRELAIDHDHDTGEIRGLLCSRCNTAIGLLKENPTLFAAAVVYLNQHQVVVYGKQSQESRQAA